MSTPAETFARWLSDGETWIGVFENHAMNSATHGARFALSFDNSQYDAAEVGKTRAPDTRMGLGWKYILAGKYRSAEEAYAAVFSEEEVEP